MADLKTYIPNLGQNAGITVGSSDVNPNLAQYASVVVPSAQILTLNTSGVNILPALGSNLAYVLTDAVVDVAAGTAYASGGTVSLFYSTTTTGTTTFIMGSVPAATFTSTTGSTSCFGSGTVQVISSAAVNLGMTGSTAFTTGTEAVTVNVWYAVISVGH